MVTYGTALQPWARVNTGNFVHNTEQSPQEYAKHAVVWPDPDGLPWDQVETVCEKSTREYGMRRAPADPTPEWTPPDVPGSTCSTCRKKIENPG
jgi:hypothetical protein